jgi:hypothetical protein
MLKSIRTGVRVFMVEGRLAVSEVRLAPPGLAASVPLAGSVKSASSAKVSLSVKVASLVEMLLSVVAEAAEAADLQRRRLLLRVTR